jgi:hypothetical protein
MPRAPITLPKWAPKERAAPLKEEYLQFHRDITRFHDRVEGYLIDEPELADELAEVPDALENFTEKMPIVLGASDLIQYVSDLRSLFDEVRRRRADRVERAERASTAASGSSTPRPGTLKVALPTSFDGSTSAVLTFLSECNTYIRLNAAQFPTDSIKVQWTLQMCSGKAANWKRIQLDQAESPYAEEHHYKWGPFQTHFKQKWGDMNAKEKAQQRFFSGLKQTGSVRRYAELFDELMLEAEFQPDRYTTAAFFAGLKTEVKLYMVGRRPDNLGDLRTLAITLDEERSGSYDTDRRDPKTRPTNRASETASSSRSEPTTRQPTTEPKAESARIGAGLSKEEREKRLREGRCFGCGEKGHRRPDCPHKTQIAAVETADLAPEASLTREESGN